MYGEYKYVSADYERRLDHLATNLMLDRLAKQVVAEEAVIIPFPRQDSEQPDPTAA